MPTHADRRRSSLAALLRSSRRAAPHARGAAEAATTPRPARSGRRCAPACSQDRPIAHRRPTLSSTLDAPARAEDAAVVPIAIRARLAADRAHAPIEQALADHRQQPVADRGDLPVHAAQRPRRHRDARARRRIHLRARDRRDQRRPALHGDALRQGLGRLLGAAGQGRAGGAGRRSARCACASTATCSRGQPAAGAADDQPPQPLRAWRWTS